MELHHRWQQFRQKFSPFHFRASFLSDLWRDRESRTKAVHRLVVLSAQVEKNAQTTLQLRVHQGGVRVGRLQEEGLDIGKQRSTLQKKTHKKSDSISMFPRDFIVHVVV